MFNRKLKNAIRACLYANGNMKAMDVRYELKVFMSKRFYVAIGQMIKSEELVVERVKGYKVLAVEGDL